MTARGTGSAAARRWQSLRDWPSRTSLRTKLITGLLALVIAAVAAISISSVWVLRSYLTSQDDNQLRSVYSSIVSGGQATGMIPGTTYWVRGTSPTTWVGVEDPSTPLSSSGSGSGSSFGGTPQAQSVPAVP